MKINKHKWCVIFDQGFIWDNLTISYCVNCGLIKKTEDSKNIYYFSKIHGNSSIPNSQECYLNLEATR